MKKLLLSMSVALALAGCGETTTTNASAPAAKVQSDAATQLADLVETYTQAFLQTQPTLSTMMAVPEAQAGGSYNDKFPDYSAAGMQSLQAMMAKDAASIAAVDSSQLTQEQLTHQKIIANILEYYAGDTQFSGGYIDTWAGHLPYIINQISGPLIDVPKLMQVQQSVTSKAEADAYLTRLQTMGTFVDQVISKYNQDAANGIVLPKKLFPKTIGFLDNFVAAKPAEHELVQTFAKKLEAVSDISASQRQALVSEATKYVAEVVYPAYARAKQAVLESEKLARAEDGVWSQPNGENFYHHSIRFLGDSSLSADDIHQLGLDEVERISAQMDAILKENGYTQGTVGERMIAIGEDPAQLYADTDDGRQALLDSLNHEIKNVMAAAPNVYGTLPTQSVEVRRIPPVSEAGEAGGFYSGPSLDGTRPGIYWINLRDMAAVPKFGLKTLTYHEAVPGHHFQIALNMAQQDIGLLRQNAPYNAYVEGWALYSEYVAATELNMYDGDPLGNLGRLQAELYRAVRLVVDTGLHRKHWTREQAIAYFHDTTGTALSDVVPEVERYMAWPGQALGYKLGMLEFVKLQKEAKAALGNKFDIRKFHDVILLPGARPMALVREDVEAWIASQKV